MSGPPPVALRPAGPEDAPFLFDLFESVRRPDLEPLGTDAQALLEMQFTAQRRHYATAHPDSEEQIVFLGARPIGHLWVDRSTDPWRLLDLALLGEARGAGTGTALLRELLADAKEAGAGVALEVSATNVAALRLYDRLGFRRLAEDGVNVSMEWSPGGD